MLNTEYERAYLASLYGGTRKWRRRVAKMPDEQVLAIYIREKRQEVRDKKEAMPEKVECPMCGSDAGFLPQGVWRSACKSCMSLIANKDIDPNSETEDNT